jgi:hypothetical protein
MKLEVMKVMKVVLEKRVKPKEEILMLIEMAMLDCI